MYPRIPQTKSRTSASTLLLIVAYCIFAFPIAASADLIKSNTLNVCEENSDFTATRFNVVFTPSNKSLSVDMVGVSSMDGNITASMTLYAYGKDVMSLSIDLCDLDIEPLCPMTPGSVTLHNPFPDIEDYTKDIPRFAYEAPDLDLVARMRINLTESGENVACIDTRLSNDKTVYQAGVGWTSACTVGVGLIVAAAANVFGHSATSTHVAANTLLLLGFFQSQAVFGMMSVPLPPIVQAWTQNMQWSMGIIRVGFLQTLATWYVRATGGKPSTTISSSNGHSVRVMKHMPVPNDWAPAEDLWAEEDHDHLAKRFQAVPSTTPNGPVIIRGIQRVGFKAGIERHNIFLTGLIFFIILIIFVILIVAICKVCCDTAVKRQWIKPDKFRGFRRTWKILLRGILYRLTLVAYPQLCLLCLWEFTQRDSPGVMVLAVVVFITTTATLTWACYKVFHLAYRSLQMHDNPPYALYSEAKTLNKWGFLYIQYRAPAFWSMIPSLMVVFIQSVFLGLVQNRGRVQAVAMFIFDCLILIAAVYMRPWMDREMNIYNVSVSVITVINALLFLFFSGVFHQGGLVTGVAGCVFFLLNAVASLVLMLIVFLSSGLAIFTKAPDNQYRRMNDDRSSWIRNESNSECEMTELGLIREDAQKNKGPSIEAKHEDVGNSETR